MPRAPPQQRANTKNYSRPFIRDRNPVILLPALMASVTNDTKAAAALRDQESNLFSGSRSTPGIMRHDEPARESPFYDDTRVHILHKGGAAPHRQTLLLVVGFLDRSSVNDR